MSLERELAIAIEAARMAGEKIMEVYRREFSVAYKEDSSPVTDADVEANRWILKTISAAFPDDAFLSEEVKDDDSRFNKKRCWIIDPLDGTKEFIKKNGEFSVSIGLVDDNRVVLGVIYLPVRDRVYYASEGQGSFRLEHNGQVTRLRVSERTRPFNVLISRSHPSKRTLAMLKLMEKDILSVTEMGSAIKGCLIAEGLYDVYYNFGHSMKWDTCAMEPIVREAGGIMRRLDDLPINYREKETRNYGFYIVNRHSNRIDLLKLM